MFPLVIETYVKGDLYQSVQIGNFKSRRAAKRAARSTHRSACIAAWPSHLSRISLGLARIGADEHRFTTGYLENAERCQRTIADDLRDRGFAAI